MKTIHRPLRAYLAPIVILFLGLTLASAADFPANPLQKTGWVLDRNDEFSGSSLDTSLWIPKYLSYRTTEERAAARYSMRDGCLVLRIDQDQLTYYPGNPMRVSNVQTGQRDYLHKDTFDHSTPTIMNYTPTYGYFEIRAKLVNQTGYHCAFWTVGRRDTPTQEAEIDIMEQYGANRANNFNLFGWDDPNITDNTGGMTLPFDPREFHIYALEWSPTSIKFYVDNVLRKTINQSFAYPSVFFLSIYENAGWTGTANTSASLYPREFIIDYFRAYKSGSTLTNHALSGAATASSTFSSTYLASKVNDGNTSLTSCWKASSTSTPQWVRIDLGSTKTVTQFKLFHASDPNYTIRNFNIQGSSDGTNFTNLVTVTGNTSTSTTHNVSAQSYRYFRLYVTGVNVGDGLARCCEFQILGN